MLSLLSSDYFLKKIQEHYQSVKWFGSRSGLTFYSGSKIFAEVISEGLFQQFWEKATGQNWEKMIDLTSKLGEINDIEHNKGSKFFLDCIMPSITT